MTKTKSQIIKEFRKRHTTRTDQTKSGNPCLFGSIESVETFITKAFQSGRESGRFEEIKFLKRLVLRSKPEAPIKLPMIDLLRGRWRQLKGTK